MVRNLKAQRQVQKLYLCAKERNNILKTLKE